MKKRVISIFLCCALVLLSFAACGGQKWQRQKATGTAAACAESAVQILKNYLSGSLSGDDAGVQLSDLVERMNNDGASSYLYGGADYAVYSAVRDVSGPYGLSSRSADDVRDIISILRYQVGQSASKAVCAPPRSSSGKTYIFDDPVFDGLPYTSATASFVGAGQYSISLTFDRMYGTSASGALSCLADAFGVASQHGDTVGASVVYTAYTQIVFRATIYQGDDGLSLFFADVTGANIISKYTSMDDLPKLINDAVRYAG